MKTASLTETKNHLSALIDRVRHGETILILDRGRPVARLESVVEGRGEAPGRAARLERAGLLRRSRHALPAEILSRKPPRPAGGGSVLAALLSDRAEGR